jgi:hypothetical protein
LRAEPHLRVLGPPLFVSDPNATGANAYRTSRTLRLTGGTRTQQEGCRMSDPNSQPRSRPAPREPEPATGLTTDQIARWADRIADGRDEFPADLADPDRSVLAAAVRARLRDRLVRLVARAIAGRMAGANTPDTQE